MGLFQTVEFDTGLEIGIASEVAKTCLKNGAAVYLCSTAVDAVLFAPPFIITQQEIQTLVDIFEISVMQVLKQRGI